MEDVWISYFGIRVTDLKRSEEFYSKLFDLVELVRVAHSTGTYVLFKDRRSGQRIELNWYSPDSKFASPYVPGEGLDHIGVRVRSVPKTLERLRKLGIEPSTKELLSDEDVWVLQNGHRVAYIKDPDENFVELYDHPEEPWDRPIPDHY
jgi:catechol 2,3-dioxygenase-like lactoylglutathione lyase family enzyme